MEWLILGSVAILIIALIATDIKPVYLFFALLMVYYFCDLISTERLLENFVNPAIIVITLLVMISHSIERTQIMEFVQRWIFSSKSGRLVQIKLFSVTALLSAFLNNTAVVASLMGVVKKNSVLPPSKLLIPLSYAAILGGTTTLIGTSTNLIVNGMAKEAGLGPLKMFTFMPIGVILTGLGLLIIILLSNKLLPGNQESSKEGNENYFLEAKVQSDSNLIGKTIFENNLRNLDNLFLADLIRDEKLFSPASPEMVICAGDILIFTGEITRIHDLKQFHGLQIFESSQRILDNNIVEVIVSHESNLVGTKIKSAKFRTKFGAAVVAVKRANERLRGKIGEIEIKAGDLLILSVGSDFYKRDNLEKNFYTTGKMLIRERINGVKGLLAFFLFLVAVVVAATTTISLIKMLLVTLFVYLLFKFMSVKEVRSIVSVNLVILIGSALGISRVLIDSHAADLLASMIQNTGGSSPFGYLVGIFMFALMLTEVVTNNAAAAITFPVAFATAQSLGVDPMPFVMAVAYGASASFLMPHSYQTNLMVFGLGNYRYRDYLKMGLPISVMYTLVVLGLIPWVFPFNP